MMRMRRVVPHAAMMLVGGMLVGCASPGPVSAPRSTPAPAPAPDPAPPPSREPAPVPSLQSETGPSPHSLQLNTGIGFTSDPTTFLIGMGLDASINRNFALGPLLQIGVDDNTTLLAPSLNFKGIFGEREFHPYVQSGLGFAYLEKEHRHGDNDEFAFLVNFGGGLDVELTQSMVIGSGILFNFLPDEALGEHFFFSWQVLTLGFRF